MEIPWKRSRLRAAWRSSLAGAEVSAGRSRASWHCSQQCQLARDRPADTSAPASDERHAARKRLLFQGISICSVYSRHENSSSYGPLFLCDTHPITRVFRGTWDPLVAVRESRKEAAICMKKFPQVIKSVKGNVLQIGCGFPYNPKVFRNKEIPGRSIPGCTGSRKLRLGV